MISFVIVDLYVSPFKGMDTYLAVLPFINIVNKYHKAPLFGLILGDGTISNCNYKNPNHNAHFTYKQGLVHKAYLEYVYKT